MQLRAKIILLLIPLIMAPVIGLALFGSARLTEDLRHSHSQRVGAVIRQLEDSFDHVHEQARITLSQIQGSTIVQDYMVETTLTRYTLLELPVLKLFNTQLATYPELLDIRILLPDGTQELSARGSGDAGERPDYAELLSEQAGHTSIFTRRQDPQVPTLIIAKPFYAVNRASDPVNARPSLRGHLVLEFSLALLEERFTSLSGRETILMLAQGDDGALLFSRFPAGARGPEGNVLNIIRMGDQLGEGYPVQLNGQRYMGISRALPAQLHLIGLVPEQAIRGPAQALQRLALMTALAVTALTTLVLYLGLNFIFLRRLNFLSEQIRIASAGNEVDSPDTVPGEDEIALVTRSFLKAQKDLRRSTESITRMAYRDGLTGLPNKVALRDNIENALNIARRHNRIVALLFLDLDNFKNVNDALGHEAGDELLRIVAEKLRESIRSGDIITTGTSKDQPHARGDEGSDLQLARLGGDEFSILLTELRAATECSTVAERIIASLSQPITVAEGNEVFVGTSIGISVFPIDGSTPETLLKHADVAMYRAKTAGKNTYRYFDKTMNDSATERLELESDMRNAIERGEFSLHYQPKLFLEKPEQRCFEALIRWNHPERGNVSPATFIPIAEECGFIRQIGDWVIEEACRQLRVWQDQGIDQVRVAINLSPVQISYGSPDLSLLRGLGKYALQASQLEIEITESGLLRDEKLAIDLLSKLRQLAFGISLDDFGTGYSSLAYLRRLPIDTVKIDRSFVKDIEEDLQSLGLMESILDLASKLNIKTVAEGVETRKQYQILAHLGVDAIQGYYFSKPLPAAEAQQFFDRIRDRHPTQKTLDQMSW